VDADTKSVLLGVMLLLTLVLFVMGVVGYFIYRLTKSKRDRYWEQLENNHEDLSRLAQETGMGAYQLLGVGRHHMERANLFWASTIWFLFGALFLIMDLIVWLGF